MHCSSAYLGAELRGLGQPGAAFGLWVCAMTDGLRFSWFAPSEVV